MHPILKKLDGLPTLLSHGLPNVTIVISELAASQASCMVYKRVGLCLFPKRVKMLIIEMSTWSPRRLGFNYSQKSSEAWRFLATQPHTSPLEAQRTPDSSSQVHTPPIPPHNPDSKGINQRIPTIHAAKPHLNTEHITDPTTNHTSASFITSPY